MITLYIECNKEFSVQMLLGALIDMGVSCDTLELLLKNENIDSEIFCSTVVVNGTEATYACCATKDDVNKIGAFPKQVNDLFLKKFNTDGKDDKFINLVCAAGMAIYDFLPDYIICSNIMGISCADIEFLRCITNEEGNPPYDQQVLSVGYGAGQKDVLRVVLYGSQQPEALKTEAFFMMV